MYTVETPDGPVKGEDLEALLTEVAEQYLLEPEEVATLRSTGQVKVDTEDGWLGFDTFVLTKQPDEPLP
jgi:hypothetical protein